MGEDELRQLLELVPDAMLLVPPDGTLAFANQQAEKLLGYTADELARLPLESLVPERFRDRHAEHYAAYFAAPVVRPMGSHLELFALCQDGHEVPVDISLGPVETAGGRLVAAILRDVSHRKLAEWDLRGAGGSAAAQRAAHRGKRLSPRGNPKHRRLRGVGGPECGVAAHPAADRASGRHRRQRLDLGRDGHRQGTGGPGDSPAQYPPGSPADQGGLCGLAGQPRSRASCLATRRAPLPGRKAGRSAASRWPTAVRFSWTKSANCPWNCRRNCCACSKRACSGGWVPRPRRKSTCG